MLEGLTSGDEKYKAWSEAQRELKVTDRETRKISRALNAIINGLAGTREDVADKFARVRSELSARSGAARTEVVVQFARKVVNQCAEMVAKSPQYAWPLAALVADVSTLAPELLDVLLAIMQVPPPHLFPFDHEFDTLYGLLYQPHPYRATVSRRQPLICPIELIQTSQNRSPIRLLHRISFRQQARIDWPNSPCK